MCKRPNTSVWRKTVMDGVTQFSIMTFSYMKTFFRRQQFLSLDVWHCFSVNDSSICKKKTFSTCCKIEHFRPTSWHKKYGFLLFNLHFQWFSFSLQIHYRSYAIHLLDGLESRVFLVCLEKCITRKKWRRSEWIISLSTTKDYKTGLSAKNARRKRKKERKPRPCSFSLHQFLKWLIWL